MLSSLAPLWAFMLLPVWIPLVGVSCGMVAERVSALRGRMAAERVSALRGRMAEPTERVAA